MQGDAESDPKMEKAIIQYLRSRGLHAEWPRFSLPESDEGPSRTVMPAPRPFLPQTGMERGSKWPKSSAMPAIGDDAELFELEKQFEKAKAAFEAIDSIQRGMEYDHEDWEGALLNVNDVIGDILAAPLGR